MIEGAAAKTDVESLLLRIEAMEQRLLAKFDALDAQMTSKIESSQSTVLTWLVGVIFATAGVLIAVIKL